MDIHYCMDSLTLKNTEKSEKMRKEYKEKRFLISLHSHLFFLREKKSESIYKISHPPALFLYDLSNLITKMKDNTLNYTVLKQKKILDWVFLVLDNSFWTNSWQAVGSMLYLSSMLGFKRQRHRHRVGRVAWVPQSHCVTSDDLGRGTSQCLPSLSALMGIGNNWVLRISLGLSVLINTENH